jgi:hypothetical protein
MIVEFDEDALSLAMHACCQYVGKFLSSPEGVLEWIVGDWQVATIDLSWQASLEDCGCCAQFQIGMSVRVPNLPQGHMNPNTISETLVTMN